MTRSPMGVGPEGDIVLRRELDGALERCVVLEAPTHAWTTPQMLVEVALGRGIDSHLGDHGLTLGVDGRGLGRVRYEVGEYNPALRAYPLTRTADPA